MSALSTIDTCKPQLKFQGGKEVVSGNLVTGGGNGVTFFRHILIEGDAPG